MTKNEAKELITENFGFQKSKISAMEISEEEGRADLAFMVCGIVYRMFFSKRQQAYILKVCRSNERIEFGI